MSAAPQFARLAKTAEERAQFFERHGQDALAKAEREAARRYRRSQRRAQRAARAQRLA
jgi:hypothetical protein